MAGDTCKTCPAFDMVYPGETDSGLCRAVPPTPVIEPETDTHHMHVMHLWAEVNATDWCSLHPARRALMTRKPEPEA